MRIQEDAIAAHADSEIALISFDADLPAECDDEYIVESADGSILFMQPADKPSKMMYLTCLGRLQDILSVALRALYSTTKSRIQMGLTGEKWRQGVVSELDSALNKWLDTIPQHCELRVSSRRYLQDTETFPVVQCDGVKHNNRLIGPLSSNRYRCISVITLCRFKYTGH